MAVTVATGGERGLWTISEVLSICKLKGPSLHDQLGGYVLISIRNKREVELFFILLCFVLFFGLGRLKAGEEVTEEMGKLSLVLK